MRRLVQPGWVLFQLVVGCCVLWGALSIERDSGQSFGAAPYVAAIFIPYALTVILLILNEGRKDVANLLRRRATSGTGREAAAGQRLSSSLRPAPLERTDPSARRDH
jgi:hypothetical protein